MKKRLVIFVLVAGTAILAAWILRGPLIAVLHGGLLAIKGKQTVADVLAEHGPRVERKWEGLFAAAGASYPPTSLVLVALKEERILEVWAEGSDAARLIVSYPIQGASGEVGPKLIRGDRQVPEGFYRIESLNPNSRFHLSMRVNYPNAEDLTRAKEEGREDPGDDIFIHGGSASVGCLAMGDPAIEELFVLVATLGAENTRVLLAPGDFRRRDIAAKPDAPRWVGPMYAALATELKTKFPRQ